MPILKKDERRGIYVELTGVVDSNDLCSLDSIIHSSSDFYRLKYVIINCLDAEDFTLSESDVKMSAAKDKAASLTNPYIKIVVVTENPRIFETINLYNNYRGGHPWNASVRTNIADARNWAGIFI